MFEQSHHFTIGKVEVSSKSRDADADALESTTAFANPMSICIDKLAISTQSYAVISQLAHCSTRVNDPTHPSAIPKPALLSNKSSSAS
jgi:hypothetical protein